MITHSESGHMHDNRFLSAIGCHEAWTLEIQALMCRFDTSAELEDHLQRQSSGLWGLLNQEAAHALNWAHCSQQ